MSRDPLLFVEDIVTGCERIVAYTEGRARKEVFDDVMRFDAILHNFQVIGEAAKRVPTEFRARHDAVSWRAIAGMRDFVAHE